MECGLTLHDLESKPAISVNTKETNFPPTKGKMMVKWSLFDEKFNKGSPSYEKI